MKLVDELLTTLPDGSVREVRIGAFWTAVVVEVTGQPCHRYNERQRWRR